MADDASYLTIAELADRLGVSESTVRNWRRAGRAAIPARTGGDGVRRYSLFVFERIAMLRERGLPLGAVEAALGDEPSEQPAPRTDPAILARLDTIIALLERIAARLDREDR